MRRRDTLSVPYLDPILAIDNSESYPQSVDAILAKPLTKLFFCMGTVGLQVPQPNFSK